MKITLYPKYLVRRPFAERGSFFSAGYGILYPEYSGNGMTPWQHYVIDGQRKGCGNGNNPPDDMFFPEGYELEYPDVERSGEDAWHHYAEKGFADGRDNGLHPDDDLFFAEGYLTMYPEVAESGLDPWHHYVLHGKSEGLDSGLHPGDGLFFSDGYLTMYPEVAESGLDPWHHYVLHGKAEGRDNGLHPGEDLFLADGYREMYPDITEHEANPWRQYVLYGKHDGRDNGLHPGADVFFVEGYLAIYPDVAGSGMDPWRHYLEYGKKEGRDNGKHPPCGIFFPEGYRLEYPDAQGSSADLWRFYVTKGMKEGQDNGLHPGDELFFPGGYLEMYHDVAKAGIDPWQHYAVSGKREGLDNGLHPAADMFFPDGYLEMYPDVKASGMSPWKHFIEIGKKEGRDNGLHPAADMFFPEGYLELYPEVKASGMSPWQHYVEIGKKKGYDTGLHPKPEQFFAGGYLEMYPDVAEAKTDPWRHYVLTGKSEGRDSGLHPAPDMFFPEGYLEMYPDVAKMGIDLWRHYIECGKKEGRNDGLHPGSEQFFAEGYLETYPDVAESGMDPWHHYVLTGKKEGRDNGQYLRTAEAPEGRIAEYWRNHSKKKKVIYTCLTGEYDRLVNYHCISDDYDYVCFTDNPALLRLKTYGVWQIQPLVFSELDNSRNSRWHKMHPHELFQQYEESIWIDSNINILTDYIFNIIKNTEEDFILPKHFYHDCIYDELKFIVQCNKDSAQHMKALYDLYTEQNLPHHLGAPETNLLYRKHHNAKIIKMMHMWWDMIVRYSNRDQASFMYVMWKNQANPCWIPNLRTDPGNFALYSHREFSNAYSMLEAQKYKILIDSHKVISFNIFDTLLVRPYLNHSDMFTLLERNVHQPGFAKARMQAESIARHCGKNEACTTLDMIYDHIGESYRHLQAKEEELELQTCQPHSLIKELYDYAVKQGKRVIAVEDTYYSSEYLKKLLAKNSYLKFDLILASSEEQVCKSDGQLYTAALSKLGCSPSDILHIGSDPALDGEKPKQLQISSAVIEKASEHLFKVNPRALEFSRIYSEDNLASSVYLGLLAINSINAQEYATRQEYFENLGYEYGGIAAWQFMKFVYEGCLKNKINDIAFLACSGLTLKRVFDLLDGKKLNSHCVYAPEALASVVVPREGSDGDELIEAFIRHGQEENISKTSEQHTSSFADSSEPVDHAKVKMSSRARTDYQEYLSKFKYLSRNLAIVDLSSGLPAAQRLFGAMYPEKKISGYCWRGNTATGADTSAFDRSGESYGILEPWPFMEFLLSSAEFRVKDVAHGNPVYDTTDNKDEKYRVANSTYVSEGIVRFAQDVRRIFREADIMFSPFMTSCLIQTLCRNPSADDRKFMRDLSFRNSCDGKYRRIFRLW